MADEGRYRLAVVRDARERAERGKRSELAAAVGTVQQAQARLDSARARTHAARESLGRAVAARDARLALGLPAATTTDRGHVATPAVIARAEHYITRRRRELESAIAEELRVEATLDEHQSGVDVARRTLARARADREVIDRHFAQWRETRRKQADRRED